MENERRRQSGSIQIQDLEKPTGTSHGKSWRNLIRVNTCNVSDNDSDHEWARETAHDAKDMQRLGKKAEFQRTFAWLPTLGFTLIYLETWEYAVLSVDQSIINGGLGGLFWEYIFTTICYTSIVLSMAEMASMAPTSGGQYHWVSEFAPPSIQRYLSYATGWLLTFAWLVGAASGYLLMTNILESCVNIFLPNYVFTNWQITLLSIAFALIVVLINAFMARSLPMIENWSLVVHTVGWLVFVILLLALAPKNSTEEAFKVVYSGGWNSDGVSFLVGSIAVVYTMLGPDAAVHVAEEIADASIVVPMCMTCGYIFNAVLAFALLIVLIYTTPDIAAIINSGESPYQPAFAAMNSNAASTVLTVILALTITLGNITAVTTTSRETWAFSRDGGLPGSRWWSQVSKRFNSPLNAVAITAVGSVVLCLLNLGSSTAFQIAVSLNVVAFVAVYILSIGCILLKRLRGQPLPPARWSLGRYSIPVNIFAVAYSVVLLVFSCFPETKDSDLSDFNWGSVIFGGVLLLVLLCWFIHGRKHFIAPVVHVEGRSAEGHVRAGGASSSAMARVKKNETVAS